MRPWTSMLLQVALLVAVASGIGLAANAVRGSKGHIDLGRNYFEKLAVTPHERIEVAASVPAEGGDTQVKTEAPPAAAQEAASADVPPEHGLQVMTFDEAYATFTDPNHESGQWVFIDARDDEHYQEGHIPSACQLDHYRPDDYIDELRPIVQSVERIVLYCNGGNCEDSILAATYLINNEGVPYELVYVYEGGFEEWKTKGGPISTGATP